MNATQCCPTGGFFRQLIEINFYLYNIKLNLVYTNQWTNLGSLESS